MSAGSRSPTPSAATDAERSLQMPRSPIEYTVTDPNATAYDVFKAHEHLGEIKNLFRSDIKNFVVFFVPSIERDAVAATASDDDVLLRQFADPPEQQSPEDIIIMNALREIIERFDTRDLCKIAHICTSFRSIAARIFRSRDNKESLGFDHSLSRMSLSMIVNFIRILHPTRLTALGSVCVDNNVILQAMAEHCPNMTELDINGRIEPETIAVLRPFFPQLRKIALSATDILGDCDDVFWQLEELRIVIFGDSAMPNMQMPRMRKLVIEYGYNNQVMFELLATNSQVTELKFEDCRFVWALLCKLAEFVPNIEQLTICKSETIHYNEGRAPSIFKCLIMCEIVGHKGLRFVDLLHGAPLKHLKLKGYHMSNDVSLRNLIDSICRLTTISSLYLDPYWQFDSELVDDHLVQITNSLGCLRELHIKYGNFTFACVRNVLSKFNGIIELDVNLAREEQVGIDFAVLDDISAMIAARPELHVKIRVSRASWTNQTPIHRLLPNYKWIEYRDD